ncbi:Perakine reductase protein [Dioscorea alata]|uniref:Perakine reductase protein n=1 Tax=Dioscorea alata TaxID=55571 RepID=A0ACB7ULM0_DIOAL|nr:Perakine reductase protein [Dioscorea alata]
MIPRVKLGTQGLEVSKLGFGCMGLSTAYNLPVPEEQGIGIIKHAFKQGITFFDTSDALKELPREEIQLATKFGIETSGRYGGMVVNGRPEYVRACCEASLKRLQIDYIDLYYQHRIDQTVPIEETISRTRITHHHICFHNHGCIDGRIEKIGGRRGNPDTIRRAHAVHPISAVQMEWSLWARDIEQEIVPLCRELGIGIVPYSPLGRGFFGGKAFVENRSENTIMVSHPRFSGENLEKNKRLYVRVENLAKNHQCSTAQLALAWVLHRGDDVAPIPGTTKIKNLDSNIGALQVNLTEEDLKEISDLVSEEEVAGSRSFSESSEKFSWKYANTPLPKLA